MLLFLMRNCWHPAGTLQSAAVVAVIVFILCGAFVFQLLESGELREKRLRERHAFRRCMGSALESASPALRHRQNSPLARYLTAKCFKETSPDWTFANAVLFAFSVVTTIGYGHVMPKTVYGRVFCSFYSIIGIPLTMIAIANMGKYTSNMIQYFEQKFRETRRKICAKLSKDMRTAVNVEETQRNRPSGQVLFITFLVYILLGSALIASWESEMSYFIAVYFSLNSLVTIGFGDYWPKNAEMLPLTLVFLTAGLGITTIALTLASDYLRKLHFYRRKLQNIQNIVIEFGATNITVGRLLTIVAKPLGVEQETIDTLNLDHIVEHEVKKQLQKLWNEETNSGEDLNQVSIKQRLIEEKKSSQEGINQDSVESEDSCVADLADEPMTSKFELIPKIDNQTKQINRSHNSLSFAYIDTSRSASSISDF